MTNTKAIVELLPSQENLVLDTISPFFLSAIEKISTTLRFSFDGRKGTDSFKVVEQNSIVLSLTDLRPKVKWIQDNSTYSKLEDKKVPIPSVLKVKYVTALKYLDINTRNIDTQVIEILKQTDSVIGTIVNNLQMLPLKMDNLKIDNKILDTIVDNINLIYDTNKTTDMVKFSDMFDNLSSLDEILNTCVVVGSIITEKRLKEVEKLSVSISDKVDKIVEYYKDNTDSKPSKSAILTLATHLDYVANLISFTAINQHLIHDIAMSFRTTVESLYTK